MRPVMRPVRFDVPAEVAFDYLVDPANRAEWQSSLARVEDVTHHVGVGQRWIDVTRAGLRPTMETIGLDRPQRWSERGTWRGISAVLTLTWEPSGAGCEVAADMRLDGRGLLRPLTALLTVVSPSAVRADLRNAARILSRRGAPE